MPRRAGCFIPTTLAAESLEPRSMLAVTATLSGGDLLIDYNAAGDVLADISSDGAKYTVSGTGLAATKFNVADVTGKIIVSDPANVAGQEFKVLAGTALANALQVNSKVETTTLVGGITATKAGNVTISSPTISLGNDISTAATSANITLSGATTLTENVTLSTGAAAGDISFGSTLNGPQVLDLTAGTGSIGFLAAVGGTAPLAGIVINSAASTTFSSTLELDGTVAAAGGYGLYIDSGVNSVTLNKAGSSISKFSDAGIYFAGGSKNTTISGVTIEGDSASGDGIEIYTGDYSGTVIQANTIKNADWGIYLDATGGAAKIENLTIGGDKTLSLGNVLTTNDDGFRIEGGDFTGTKIIGNTISLSQDIGIYFHTDVSLTNLTVGAGLGGDGAKFGNRIETTTSGDATGIRVEPGTYTGTVIGGGNEITENGYGIDLLDGDFTKNLTIAQNAIGTLLDGTTKKGNTQYGIRVRGPGPVVGGGDYTGTVIQSNDIAFNGVTGVWLDANDGNLTNLTLGGDKTASPSLGNKIRENGNDGIQVDVGAYAGTVIRGNQITKNVFTGILLNTNAGGLISGLTVGAGAGASLADQSKFGNEISLNGLSGIYAETGNYINTVIGAGNEIWGNSENGINLEGGGATNLKITGNLIGTRQDGTADKGNGSHGILVGPGDYTGTVIQANVIAANKIDGINLNAAANKITNLKIGGDKTASPSQGNEIFSNVSDGIQANAGDYTGTVIQGNRIGSPSRDFEIAPGSTTATFAGDLTGYVFTGQAIFLKPMEPASAVNAVKRVITAVAVVGGNTEVTLSAPIDATTTFGEAVVGNGENGIFLATFGSDVTNLTIGGGKSGAGKFANEIFANTLNGIRVSAVKLTGTVIGERNEITLNGTNGIFLAGGQDLLIQRNLIGLKSDNKAGNGNTLAGIYAEFGDYTGAKVVLNTIGYNGTNGIELEEAKNLTVGGLPVTDANTILRNTLAGVLASGDSSGTTVKSNLIDRNKIGVQLDGATGILIGGTTSKEANTITGNTDAGVEATGLLTGSRLHGNVISGSATGVALFDAKDFAVGGDKLGMGNRVFSNTQGLTAQGDSAGTKVLGNSFTGNDVGAQLVGATGLTIGGGDHSNALSRNVFDANPTGIQASGLLTDTKVTGNIIKNGVTGISLDNAREILIGGATPLAGNSVEMQSTNGVYATGLLTGSKVQNNSILDGYVGVTLDHAENLLVDKNTISNNTKTGISAFGELAGTTVSNNTLSANESGIVLNDLIGKGIVHDLTVTKNTILDSAQDGIYATGDLSGSSVTDNTIDGSGESGIALVSATKLPVTGNVITDSGKNGIYATGNLAGSTVTKNSIAGSGEAGIALESATNLPVTANTVTDSVKDGVYATGDLFGSSLSGNVVQKSGATGIALVSAKNLPVTANEVTDSVKNGIYATGDLFGSSVANNKILRAGEAGISLESATNLPVTANTVADSVKRGLYATGDSTGTQVKSNVFSNSGTDGAALVAATNLLVSANEFNDSGDRGLFATGDLFGSKVESNTINRSKGTYATVLDSAKNLQFVTNEINDSVKSGLYATGDLFGTQVQSSTINRTKGPYGAVLSSAKYLTVTTSAINDSVGGGLYATGDLSGTKVQNSAVNRSQGDFAVVLQAAKNLQFSSNTLADSKKSGLFATGDLTGTKVLSNSITNTGTVAASHVSVSLIDATNLAFGELGAGNTIKGGAGAGLFSSGNLLGTTVRSNLFDGTRSGMVLSKAKNGTFGGATAGEGNTIIGGGSLPLGEYRDGIFAAGDSAGSTVTGTVIQDAWIGVSLNWVENLAVSKTTVTNQQGIGLYAQGASPGTTVTSMGVVRTVAPTLSTSGAILNAVTGLSLSNSEFSGDTTALFVFNESTNTSILSSKFAGLTTGAGLFSATNLVFGLDGQGNSVTGGQTGGYVTGGVKGSSLVGNTFRATSVGGTALALVSATELFAAKNVLTGSSVGLYTTGQAAGTELVSNLIDGNVTGFSISATRDLTFGKFKQGNTISNSSFAGLIASGNCIGSVVLFTGWIGNATNVINDASPPLVVSPTS